jgi:hypothetical protein
MNRLLQSQSPKPTKNMARKSKTYRPPSEEEIACYAYAILAAEQPQRAQEAWRQAEAQLIADRQHDAGLLPSVDSLSVPSYQEIK